MGVERILAFFVLGIAFWEAWQLNRANQLVFNGPYRLAPA
jgi:hypothetical protein